jgi:hypothetical protein
VSVIGTAAEIITGKRDLSVAQTKKLAEFFRVGVEEFIPRSAIHALRRR